MDAPLTISLQEVLGSNTLERLIREEAVELERICGHLISCRVSIAAEKLSRNRAANAGYEIRIEMRIPPGSSFVVSSKAGSEAGDDSLERVLKTSFSAARRYLRQAAIKRPTPRKRHWDREVNGLISAVYLDEGYGFLRRLDGEEIFFHRDSVHNGDFRSLQPGIGVNCISERGKRGLQAASVEIVDTSIVTD